MMDCEQKRQRNILKWEENRTWRTIGRNQESATLWKSCVDKTRSLHNDGY